MSEPFVTITSIAHVPRMRAHKILMDAGYQNWKIVIDGQDQRLRCLEIGIPYDNIVVTDRVPEDTPRQDRIAWKRQWIEENLVPRGEWYVTLDDNVSGWSWLPTPWYHQDKWDLSLDSPVQGLAEIDPSVTWRELYATICPFETVVKIWEGHIKRCEARGTWAGGFAIENNFFFRGRKWQTLGYVRTSNAVLKNMGLPFYYWKGAMQEDMIRSVDVAVRTGSVLINRYLKVQKPAFEAGGIGTFEERRPFLTALSNELMRRYPGLLRPVKDHDYQLTFAQRDIARWKQKTGYKDG